MKRKVSEADRRANKKQVRGVSKNLRENMKLFPRENRI